MKLYEQQIDANGGKVKLDVKRLSHFVTVDIIGKIVFSMEVDCFHNQNDPFLRNIFKLNTIPILHIVLMLLVPQSVLGWLKIKTFNSKAINYFAHLTETLIERRKENPENRYQDFLQLLIESEADTTNLTEGEWDKQQKRLTKEGMEKFYYLFKSFTQRESIDEI